MNGFIKKLMFLSICLVLQLYIGWEASIIFLLVVIFTIVVDIFDEIKISIKNIRGA